MLGKALKAKVENAIMGRGAGGAIEAARPTEIAFVLDRSASMDSWRKEAVKGFNKFVAEQRREPGRAVLSLRQFNDGYATTFDGCALADVPKLTTKEFEPDGMTAIYDAIGRTIAEVMTRHTNTPEPDRPGRTLVVILTDGEENASREYSHALVHDMVCRAREVFGWEFVLIGMGIDAAELAVRVGIDARKALSVSASAAGMLDSMRTVSTITSRYRADGEIPPLLTGHKR